MSIDDLIKDSDGFKIGVCIATINIISYFTYIDMKAKDYRILPFKEGVENVKEMFREDTTYKHKHKTYNTRIDRGLLK